MQPWLEGFTGRQEHKSPGLPQTSVSEPENSLQGVGSGGKDSEKQHQDPLLPPAGPVSK